MYTPPPAVYPLVALTATRGFSLDASENVELRTTRAVYWSESLQERSEWEKSSLAVSEWIEMKTAIVFLAFVVSSRPAERSRVITTKANLKLLQTAVGEFKSDTGRLPTAAEGLNALIHQPSGVPNWHAGGYLDTPDVPKDAWDHEFVYALDPNLPGGFGIYSCGRDGITVSNGNDTDDINPWSTHPSWPAYYQALAMKEKGRERDKSALVFLVVIAAAFTLGRVLGFRPWTSDSA